MQSEEARAAALAVRRDVLGDEYVSRSMNRDSPMDKAQQDFVLEHCWGAVWTRPGLDRKTRSIVNVSMLAATGHSDELKLHLGGALRNGLTVEEITEILLQVGVYAGTPALVSAFRIMREVLAEFPQG